AVPAGGRGAALGRGVPARVRVPGERRAAGAAADRAATNGLNSPSWRGGGEASAPQFRQVPETCGIGLATLTLGGTVVSVPREKPAVGIVLAPPSPNPWRAGALIVRYTLGGGHDAVLELIDLAGHIITARSLSPGLSNDSQSPALRRPPVSRTSPPVSCPADCDFASYLPS